MSILHGAIGANDPGSVDDPTLRRLAFALRGIEPDPLFRRRLRGEVLNRHVAAREGHLRHPRSRRRMGTLGRAALYASFGLALSVSATVAAADRALPGDMLYPVKLQLEGLRMHVAPPSFRDELAVLAVAERVTELERLAAAGSWRLVPEAAARVSAAEDALLAIDRVAGGAAASRAMQALESVLADAPPQAHVGVQRALANVNRAAGGPADRPHPHAVSGPRSETGKPPPPAARPTAAPDHEPPGQDRRRGRPDDPPRGRR